MTDLAEDVGGARADEVVDALELHRRELTGFCYRMLGSAFEAEDAVQETLVRAWRARDGYEGRASVRSWLYQIATNACIDLLNGRNRRALPMDMTAASPPIEESLGAPRPDVMWLEPANDDRVLPLTGDPADLAVARDSIRLAFVATLQHLPPRQRAVLILREVLRFSAEEVAGLLDSTVAAVNSALQRARATLGRLDLEAVPPGDGLDAERRELLDRYVEAFEAYDIVAMVALLAEDATQSMPPYELWLRGPADIGAWQAGPGSGCAGSRLLPVRVNGARGFAQYRPDPGGHFEPFAIHVVDTAGGRITRITNFLDTRLFSLFDLPPFLPR